MNSPIDDHPQRYAPQPLMMPVGDEQELDLRKLFDSVWGGRWIILVTVLLGALAAGAYLITTRPIFMANGLVQVEEEEKGMTPSMEDLSAAFGGSAKTSAEIEILQSRLVLGKVIDDLKLEIAAEPRYFPKIGRFWARKAYGAPSEGVWWQQFAWGGEKIEVSTFNVPDSLRDAAFTLIATGQGYLLLGPNMETILDGAVGETAVGEAGGEPVEIFVKSLSAAAGRHFSVVRRSRLATYSDVSGRFQVTEQGRQSGIIELTARDFSPVGAAEIVRKSQDAYVRQNVERRSAEAQQSLEFLQKQLPSIKEKVDAAQTQLNAYQVKQDSVDVTKETELILQQSVELETRRLELQQERQVALQRFTLKHPVILAIDGQIARIASEFGSVKKLSETLPAKQQEILSLLRDLEVNEQLYTTLLNSAQELQIAKAGTIGSVRIIDYPLIPKSKALPRGRSVMMLGLVLGFVVGVVITFIKMTLNKGVSDPSQVEQAFGLASYAAIPYSRQQSKFRRFIERGKSGFHVLAAMDPSDVAIEALRSLRISLQFALLESRSNVLMLTGPTPGIGKSFVAMNLGVVLAASGKKVVVIDGDLRRGALNKYCGVTREPGVTDFILGSADALQVLRKTPITHLSFVARGTAAPNPGELLMHPRFSELINTLSLNHDLVIVDAPPVLPVADACVIGALAGCTLIVLKDHEHTMPAIEDTVRRLQQAGVNPKGVIFNQMGRSPGSYGYRAYGSYRYDQKYN
ncbi:MAG: polysaccharide biosynthesis tyrosine autokinase [Panacagrimonas sp.]